MPRIRPVWLIPITVIVIVAAVPELRRQAIAQCQLVPLPNSPSRRIYQIDEPAPGGRSLALDAARFVELNHPDDPEMLTAAGIYMGTSMKLFERKAGPARPRPRQRQRSAGARAAAAARQTARSIPSIAPSGPRLSGSLARRHPPQEGTASEGAVHWSYMVE